MSASHPSLPTISAKTNAVLPVVTQEVRHEISEQSVAAHAHYLTILGLFDQVEYRPPPTTREALDRGARIAYWNAARCKFPAQSVELLRSADADIALLAEMDNGMARSGNRHTTREVAAALNMGYAFAVEYLELGLGDEQERAEHAGQRNDLGLHGGSILAPWDIRRPAVLRLDQNGAWFGHANGERRVGGRIAVAGLVRIAATDVCCVSVHLESHSDPGERAGQMATLIDAIDRCYGEHPTIIGGDFNTSTIDTRTEKGRASKARLARADWDRFAEPIRFEPLFDVAAGAGYDWTASNAPGTTTRKGPHDPPDKPMEKIDWFLTRGLRASDPRIIPAVDQNGLAISDHELLAVTVKPG